MKKYKFWTKNSEILQVQKTVIGWRQKKKGGWVNEPESEFKKGINVVNNYPRHQF